ncbi:FRG domain-containing protein [Tardiphaga sp. vice278]|uniref:FRG domain-containing protein n=1 Tax=Tardiphaga sp. vice278 TaxID=2592815 RepID=UPI0011643C43|nr:FRG domain-containing protein [Tardiphaga sp. vice278]QDM18173.1 FRG domain-containing protein [Tardiphaga sp. vice278]
MDAEGFIAFLRASNSAWHDSTDFPQWVFRGHRNASWRLKPTAWRSAGSNPLQNMIAKLTAAELRLKDGRDNPDTLTENLQRALAWTHAEKLVLNEFRRVGWRMGFDVDEPDASYSMNLKYGPSLIDDTRQAPESESPFWSANDIGIAQHYGVPTRFLDWTFNPMFAIFFSQDDFGSNLNETDLCVWAMDINAVESMYHFKGGVGTTLLRPFSPCRRGNDFIIAQNGLLLEIQHEWALDFFEQNGDWPSVEEVVVALNNEREYCDGDPESYLYDQDHPMLRRIVLPAKEIPHLRVMLDREGITREKLMPTLENAAKAAVRAISKA